MHWLLDILAPPHPDYLLDPFIFPSSPSPSAQDAKTIEHMEKVNLRKYQVTHIASTIGTVSLCVM